MKYEQLLQANKIVAEIEKVEDRINEMLAFRETVIGCEKVDIVSLSTGKEDDEGWSYGWRRAEINIIPDDIISFLDDLITANKYYKQTQEKLLEEL